MTDMIERMPNVQAMLAGRVSGHWSEWPALRSEVKTLIATLREQQERIRALEQRLAEVREIYAGMEGFIPQTAPEGYCLDIIRKMAHAAIDAEAK